MNFFLEDGFIHIALISQHDVDDEAGTSTFHRAFYCHDPIKPYIYKHIAKTTYNNQR
jgi:hypothetical protein